MWNAIHVYNHGTPAGYINPSMPCHADIHGSRLKTCFRIVDGTCVSARDNIEQTWNITPIYTFEPGKRTGREIALASKSHLCIRDRGLITELGSKTQNEFQITPTVRRKHIRV